MAATYRDCSSVRSFDFADTSPCALCGCESTHLAAVQIDSGNDEAVTVLSGDDGRNGVSLHSLFDAQTLGRGSAVSVWRWCEVGCSWLEGLSFHQGATYRYVVRLATSDGSVEPPSLPELWRD